MEDISEYLSGKKLYGDDFNIDKIKEWFDYQGQFYNDNDNPLNYNDKSTYTYSYHALNIAHGYKYLPKDKKFKHLLGFGSAYGEELKPIIDQIETISILEISNNFINTQIFGKPVTYLKPSMDGKLPFADNSVDLIICFGVLHHIPNVSEIIKEFSRVLMSDGYAIIREPINSMGDWRLPRKGISINERGIPVHIFRQIFKDNNLKIVKEKIWYFKLTMIIMLILNGFTKKSLFNYKWAVNLDYFFSKLFRWNINYHPKNKFRTIRPTAVFYVIKKD